MIINAASTLPCNDMILTSSPLVLSLWPSRHNKYQISVYQPSSQYLLWKCKLVSCFKPSKVILGMRSCECIDLHKEILPYEDAWDWQKSIVEEKKVLVGKGEDCSDTIIILQHQPVYTLGTRSSVNNLKFSMENSAHEIYRTERGGEVTYHGPGQLVMYPIMNLRYHKMDLHWYLRALEEVVIRVLNSTFSMNACRIEGLTGVWVEDQKLAAVGIRVSKWITYHGLALNVTTDLAPFDQIIPCGIQDRRVGTIKGLLGKYLPSDGVMLEDDDSRLIDVTYHSLIKEFSEVFQVQLRHMPSSILWKKLGACLLYSNWKKKYT